MDLKSLFDKEKLVRLLLIAGFVAVIDQVTKIIILKKIALYHAIPVIKGFFNIVHVQNPGGAFSLFANQSQEIRTLVFLVIATLAVIFILYIYKGVPNTHVWLSRALAMIVGGAIGNLIDRVRVGTVTDFLDFYLGNMHWPAFNVADSAISIGVAIFIWHLLFNKMPEEM